MTPSTWLALRQCAWRVLLARHYQNKPLLPPHPNAALGSILHNALEKITRGELKTKEDFDLWWDAAVSKTEQELTGKGWGQFVPLKENTRHFGLKKIQARNRLEMNQRIHPTGDGTFSKIAEQKLISSGGLLAGQLDCIIWREGQAEIRDYKTGAITTNEEGEETSKVKEEYALQMKLYACLFHEQYGYFPGRLVLEDLNGAEHEICVNAEECLKLLEEVRSTLLAVNRRIANGEWEVLANPGEHCVHCQNRPACEKYLHSLETDPVLAKTGRFDLTGKLVGCEMKTCGDWLLRLEKGGEIYTITGFEAARLPEIAAITDKKVTIFNVRTAGAQKIACSKFSYIYAI